MASHGTTGRLVAIGAFAVFVCLGGSAAAQSPLIKAGVSHETVHLESRRVVQTWETDGVQVFVVAGGAEVRQGDVRLSAPNMVVWFDKNESLRDDVKAATVRVYAQGTGKPGGEPRVPAILVEAGQARARGVVYMRFRSKLAFAWNCKLEQVKDPASVPFFAAVEPEVKGVTVDYERANLPEFVPARTEQQMIGAIKADEQTIFFDTAAKTITFVFLGDVRYPYGSIDVSSDVLVIWVNTEDRTYEAYARGNVVLAKRPGAEVAQGDRLGDFASRLESMRADEVYINPKRDRGLGTNVELRVSADQTATEDVYVVRASQLYMLDSENLYMREGSFTTCPFAHPHYQLTGEQVTATYQKPTTFLSAWGARVKLGKEDRTLISWPFLAMGLGREGTALRSIAVGSSRRFGAFVRSSVRLTHLGWDYDWIDRWTLDLDYYGKRGPGIGTELGYKFVGEDGAEHRGYLQGYYVHDSGKEDGTGLPVPKTDRGRLAFRHRSPLGQYWRADVEFNWLSDVGFLREYFQQEFEQQKPPETYAMARYRKDSTWMGLLVKKRVNSFLTQVQELPSARLERIAVPVGRGVYDASYDVGYYDLEPSDQLMMANPPGLGRAHTEQRMSWPFNVGRVRVDPFVRVLGTWASKQALSGGSYSGSQSRLGAGGGVRASIDYARSFDVFSETFQLNRLRHIVTPFVEFDTLPVMTADSSDFVQLDGFDPWPMGGRGARPGEQYIDAVDKRTELRLGLRQRLQTKRGGPGKWRAVDWMELDVAYVIRSDDSVAVVTDDDYVDVNFDWWLTPALTLYSHDNRISTQGGTDILNAGAGLDLSESTRVGLDYLYMSNTTSRLRGSFFGMLSDRYGLMLSEDYELNPATSSAAANMETHVVLRRFLHEWIFDIGLHYERANNEYAVTVGFAPLIGGRWGSSPWGTGYGRQQ